MTKPRRKAGPKGRAADARGSGGDREAGAEVTRLRWLLVWSACLAAGLCVGRWLP